MEKSEQAKNKPVKTYKLGSVKISVWENTSKDDKKFNSVSLQRNYKDGDEWKVSNSFNMSDLPNLSALCMKVTEEFGVYELKAKE